MKTKITGLKKAVGEYQRANAGGYYSPRYGYLMFDLEDGKLWTDEFYSLGHNSWKQYHSPTIINLGGRMAEHGLDVTMKNVREFVENKLHAYKIKEIETNVTDESKSFSTMKNAVDYYEECVGGEFEPRLVY